MIWDPVINFPQFRKSLLLKFYIFSFTNQNCVFISFSSYSGTKIQKATIVTFYFKQVSKIMNNCYSNRGQLETVIGTRHYIINNFDKDLNLDFLSKARCTSKFHLIRLFKKYHGQTPKQYIIDIRIERAKVLLKKGTTITGTCFEIGFDTPSTFSTLFKSRVGLPPIEFQKRATFTKSE